MEILHITEEYWSAWKRFKWEKPIPGIGIAEGKVKQALEKAEPVRLTIGNDKTVYKISPVKIANVVKKYNSMMEVRRGVKVAVIPRNILIKN
jgi:hypothetical protein